MGKLKGKYKYLIFDFDGTINNTSPGIFATFKAVLDKMGVSYDGVDFFEHIGPPLEWSYQQLVDKDRIDEGIALHKKIFDETNATKNSFLYDGITDALQRLNDAGYVLSIASSKYEPHAVQSLKDLKIERYFCCLYGQNERRGFKSEVLRQLIEDNGWDKSQCLMIGDTLHDMKGAQDNGLDFLAVSYGFGKIQDMASHAVAVADSPSQIADLLL